MNVLARRASLALLLLAAAASAQGADPPKMDCAKLVPADLVARHLAGAQVQPQFPDQRSVLCNLNQGSNIAAQVSYGCRPTDTFAAYQEKEAKKKSKDQALPGVGRAGFGRDRRVVFYDDDTDCLVEVTDHAAQPVSVALARDVAAALKPALLPALPKGKYALSCEKLLPAPLLSKWAPGAKIVASYVQADQMNCDLKGGATITVGYACRSRVEAGYWPRYKEEMVKSQAVDLSDAPIGTGGVFASVQGMPTVAFSDGETGCLVTILGIGVEKAKLLGLAGDAEKALTLESAR